MDRWGKWDKNQFASWKCSSHSTWRTNIDCFLFLIPGFIRKSNWDYMNCERHVHLIANSIPCLL